MLKVKPLQVFSTPEGSMFPIYRDWDEWHGGHVPKMVYATTMAPLTTKGPILHMKRTALITAICGNVMLSYYHDNVISEISLREKDKSNVVLIPPKIPIELKNLSECEIAVVINAPSPAWHPDDEDTQKFLSWLDYENWLKNETPI